MSLEAEGVKAIDIIREKKRKAPSIESIHLHLENNNINAGKGLVRASLDELVTKRHIEDRGKNGYQSHFVINNEIIMSFLLNKMSS